MFCKNCGNSVNEGQIFCSICGAPIEQPQMQQAQPQPQQAYTQQPQYGQQTYAQQGGYQQPQQFGYQQPQQEQQFYNQYGNIQQPQQGPYSKLGGYLLVMVIILFVNATFALIFNIGSIDSILDSASWMITSSSDRYVPLGVACYIAVIRLLLFNGGLIASGILIILKKKFSTKLYFITSVAGFAMSLTMIAIIAIQSASYYSIDFTDYFSVSSIFDLLLNIGFFVANMLYLKKEPRVKMYFGLDQNPTFNINEANPYGYN